MPARAEAPPLVIARADRQQCPPAPHPAALRERGIEGAVLLRVKVDVQGRAADVQLLAGSGWRLFDEAALQQVRACRFIPATQGGQAIDSWVEFPVRFALAG
jgi:protein TonB